MIITTYAKLALEQLKNYDGINPIEDLLIQADLSEHEANQIR